MPGIDGKVIIDDTCPLVLAGPSEFDDFCSYYNQEAEEVMCSFIADASGLQDVPEALAKMVTTRMRPLNSG